MLSKSKELANLAVSGHFYHPLGMGRLCSWELEEWMDGQTDGQTNFWTPHRISLSLSKFLGLSNQVHKN